MYRGVSFDGDLADYSWCLSENKEIEVILDSELISSISNNNPNLIIEENPLRIRINLFELILAIGCIKTRRSNPTNRQSFLDKCDLLESLMDSSDFKIVLWDDSEVKKETSEEFGIGLSILITDYLYNIQWSTLAKIPLMGRQSKPDIKCLTNDSQEIVIEAKGTTNKSRRKKQKDHSLQQKRTLPADIRISSCSLLKNEMISDVEYDDPPVIPPTDRKYTELLLKADHYSRVFNFIGQKELSLYFNLMRKRIIHNKEFHEYPEKDRLFNRIKNEYIRLSKFGKVFLGNIEMDNSGKYLFIGLDKTLVSLKGFIDFKDYTIDSNDSNISENDTNTYYVSSDGLCFARLTDIGFLENQLKDKVISHYQESTSIIDIDSMNLSSFENYILYLFEKMDCTVIKDFSFQQKNTNERLFHDLIVVHNDNRILIEVKKSLSDEKLESIYQLVNYAEKCQCQKIILFTAKPIKEKLITQISNLNIALIDRKKLKHIVEDNSLLLEYL